MYFYKKNCHLSGSNLQFGISGHLLVISFVGTVLQNTASLSRSSLKKIKKSDKLILGLNREIKEHRQIDNTAHSGNTPDCIVFVHEA